MCMSICLEFSVVFTVAILPQVLIAFYPDEIRDLLSKLPGNWRFLSTLPSRIGAILLILYISATRSDEFHSIGLNLQDATSSLALLGTGLLTGYLLLIFVFSSLRSKKVKGEITNMQQRTLTILRYSNTTGFWQRLFYFIDLWLAVIGEELVYRGYLILLLGRQTGNLIPWMTFSVTLSIVVHLYQGRTWRLAISHMIFASLFIFAAVVTNSLFAALIPHLAYNTVWLIRALRHTSKKVVTQVDDNSQSL
jgi:membrane protease YdiL (CAAX protease family)